MLKLIISPAKFKPNFFFFVICHQSAIQYYYCNRASSKNHWGPTSFCRISRTATGVLAQIPFRFFYHQYRADAHYWWVRFFLHPHFLLGVMITHLPLSSSLVQIKGKHLLHTKKSEHVRGKKMVFSNWQKKLIGQTMS